MHGFLAIIGLMVWTSMVQAQQTPHLGHHGKVQPPIGWEQFCQTPPGRYECEMAPTNPVWVVLTETTWRQLVQINSEVNRDVTPLSDNAHWGEDERWSFPTDGKGDCEDYVLEKRKRLIEAGWPRSALLITIVLDDLGEGHAVLMVRTDRGDFLLDNQAGKILRWDETSYRFLKRQAGEHPNRWVSLGYIKARGVTSQ